jgi:hypothetical protein
VPIAFACSCGKKIHLGDDMAGRRIRCPRCEKSLPVPAPDKESEVEVEEDGPGEKRNEFRRVKRPHKKGGKRGGGSALVAVLWVLGILLVLGGGVGWGLYALFTAKPGSSGGLFGSDLPEDFLFVADNARDFSTLRVAELDKRLEQTVLLWQMKKQLDKKFTDRLGLNPAEVERWTKVHQTGGQMGGGWTEIFEWEIVVTTTPYDQAKVMQTYVGPNPRQAGGARTYYAAPGMGPDQQCVHFHSKNVFVIASREPAMMAALSSYPGKSPSEPFRSAAQKSASGSVLVTAGRGTNTLGTFGLGLFGSDSHAVEYSSVTLKGDHATAEYVTTFNAPLTEEVAKARFERTRKAMIADKFRASGLRVSLPTATVSVSRTQGTVSFSNDAIILLTVIANHDLFQF